MIRDHSPRKFIPAVLAIAVGTRLGSALVQGNSIETLPGIWDQVSYHHLALRVLHGHGFTFGSNWWPATAAGAPTAHWSYLYVLYMAAVYFVFGSNPLAARIIQALVAGILQPLLTWRITRRVIGERVAAVATLLISVYGYFIYYAGALVTETFCIVSILWMVDVATGLGATPSERPERTRQWVWLGIACGTATLMRQVVIFVVPLVLIWTLWRSFGREKGLPRFRLTHLLGRATIAVLIIAGCILPWTVRNYEAFGRFVFLNTNAGFAFFWGNHPLHGTHFIPIIGGGQQYGALIPPELRGLNEAELDRRLLKRGLRFVTDDPSRFALLSLSRAKEYFKFWPTSKSGPISNLARVFSFGVYLPLFIIGLIVAAFRFRSRVEQDTQALLLILLLAGLYTGIHLLSWTLVRYRLPVDAVMMPFGALGLFSLIDWARGRDTQPTCDEDQNQFPLETPARS
jgi:hypothetical protein